MRYFATLTIVPLVIGVFAPNAPIILPKRVLMYDYLSGDDCRRNQIIEMSTSAHSSQAIWQCTTIAV